jgi:hypothetical protein
MGISTKPSRNLITTGGIAIKKGGGAHHGGLADFAIAAE